MAVPEVAFDPVAHTYHVGGERWPSVTEVLSPLVDFSGVPRGTLEAKRQLGQDVHAMCAMALRGTLDEAALDEELRPYLTALRRFLAESGVTVLASERVVCHPTYRYCGTLDLVVLPPRKNAVTKWLIDVKCAAAVPPTVGPQCAAYEKAYGRAVQRKVLRLWPNDYRLDALDDPADWSVFLASLTLFNWRKRHGIHRDRDAA